MKRFTWIMTALLCMPLFCAAQKVTIPELRTYSANDTAYIHTIINRSEKNISSLPLLKGSDEWTAVRNTVANRYFELNDIYAERDAAIKTAKESMTGDAKQKAIDMAKAVCDSRLYRSHFAFSANLSLILNDEQITAVKDALTYNKVKVTYDAYLDEIPSLKEEEKVQIYAWLCEAREIAIDAENSKMKHDAFNKYKGRIANYLSKHGYDLNKEREAWFKRIKEREGKK